MASSVTKTLPVKLLLLQSEGLVDVKVQSYGTSKGPKKQVTLDSDGFTTVVRRKSVQKAKTRKTKPKSTQPRRQQALKSVPRRTPQKVVTKEVVNKSKRVNYNGNDNVWDVIEFVSPEQERKVQKQTTKSPKVVASKELQNPLPQVHVDTSDLYKVSKARDIDDSEVEKSQQSQKLRCFDTNEHFTQQVIGLPISIRRRNDYYYLDCPFVYQSYQSFHSKKTRETSWKERFQHWLPLWIDEKHARRASVHVDRAILNIWMDLQKRNFGRFTGDYWTMPTFAPKMVLEVIPPLMSSIVSRLYSWKSKNISAPIEAYRACHRLLISYVERFPALRKMVNQIAVKFIRSDVERRSWWDLNEFLQMATVADRVTWNHLCFPFLKELFERVAKRSARVFPRNKNVPTNFTLKTAVPCPADNYRNATTFECNSRTLKIAAMNVYFFTHVARTLGIATESTTLAYDAALSLPSKSMISSISQKLAEMDSMKSFDAFFLHMGITPIKGNTLTAWLLQATKNTSKRQRN